MAVNTPILKGNTTTLVEHKTSPRYEFAEKFTVTRIYEGVYSVCLSSASARGTLGSGAMSGYVVAKSTVEKLGNGFGRLTVIWEAGGSSSEEPLPPDEYSADPFEVNPGLEKNSIFSPVTADERTLVYTAIEGATPEQRNAAITSINNDGSAASTVLLDLKLKAVDSYYLAGIRYTWTQYSWGIPSMTFGGFIQSPSGPLASYFTGGLSWLRESDQLSFDGAKFRLTKSWLGGPAGHWDSDLYAP